MNGYCIKCHMETRIANDKKIIAKDGKRWLKGNCPICGMAVWKRLPRQEQDLDLVVVYHLT